MYDVAVSADPTKAVSPFNQLKFGSENLTIGCAAGQDIQEKKDDELTATSGLDLTLQIEVRFIGAVFPHSGSYLFCW